MKVKTEEMSDLQLLESYKKGKKWVSDRIQVTGTNRNKVGGLYNPTEFIAGLKRLEEIEYEMARRGIDYE
jgi:hypothetical protein